MRSLLAIAFLLVTAPAFAQAPAPLAADACGGCQGVGARGAGDILALAGKPAEQIVAAIALVRGEQPPGKASDFNTCYSHVGNESGISVVGIFRPGPQGFVETPNSGGIAPRGNLPERRRLEALYADAGYRSITDWMFGA